MSAEMDAVLVTLHQTLDSSSKLILTGDYAASERSIAELVNFLNSISESLVAEEPQHSQELAVEILTRIHQYVAAPALEQEIIEALSFELPKAVARFACVSARCLEVAEGVVDLFVERCSPREMLSILLEAISSLGDLFTVPSCFIPLLSGLTKVIVLIQRRLYEQVKNAVPIILNVLTTMCLKSDDEDSDYEKLFHRAIGIACSIRTVSIKLESKDSKKLKALLGLYVLQIMALVSLVMTSDISRYLPLVLQLSDFLPHCDLSYIGLVTESEVVMISKLVIGDDSEVGVDCFSQVKLGAALAVIWGFRESKVAVAAKADLTSVLMELQGNWTRRWEAIGMLKYIFSCANLPWALKLDGIKFLLCVMDGIVLDTDNDCVDYSSHMTTMYTSLKAIEMVIMYSPDSALRKNAFIAFKKMLADIPSRWRFDVYMVLIKNTHSSPMMGILINCVKEEMLLERNASALNSEVSQSTWFWKPSVVEVVEMVLRPPKGGPPSLPEYSDAVLSALNLYRFILISESTGNSNSTGIVSKGQLEKAYKEWLLPLRALVSGAVAVAAAEESMSDADSNPMCALNPLELVLYRCIELVEEHLKHL